MSIQTYLDTVEIARFALARLPLKSGNSKLDDMIDEADTTLLDAVELLTQLRNHECKRAQSVEASPDKADTSVSETSEAAN